MACVAVIWRQDITTAGLLLFTVAGLGIFSATDLENGTIPNRLVVPFAALNLVAVTALGIILTDWPRLIQAIGVTMIYTLAFLVLWFLRHLGAGDIKLMFAVLVVTGWLGLLPTMIWIVASWLPTLVHSLVIKSKQQQPGSIPQAQYFAAGFVFIALLSPYLEQL